MRPSPAAAAAAAGLGLVAALAAASLLLRRALRNSPETRGSAQEPDAALDEVLLALLPPSGQREILKKEKLAGAKRKPVSGRWHPGAIPPGNFPTKKWLRTDLGVPIPKDHCLDEEGWRLELRFNGASRTITLKDIESLGMECFSVDWHCVTGWSFCGLELEGVKIGKVLGLLGPDAAKGRDWKCLYQKSADGYTAPVYKQDALADECFLALRQNGSIISAEHGGPRLVFPSLWGWKSAKFLTSIELLPEFQVGFWEQLKCHDRARIYNENLDFIDERFSANVSGLWKWFTWMVNLYHRLPYGDFAYETIMGIGGRLVGLSFRWLL